MSTEQVAWLGLGNMGRGMVANMVTKAGLGAPLIIQNRTRTRSESFAATLPADRVTIAGSVADAVAPAAIVFTCLGGDQSVLDTYAEALAVPGGAAGKLFVETSTILPETTDEVARRVQAAGGSFVANPVFGAPAAADAGTLMCVLAGPSAAIDRVLPFCDGVRSRTTIAMRDAPPGRASLLKITGNSFILSLVETLAEGHAWAAKSGLGAEALHGFIEGMLGGPWVAYSKRMMAGDYVRDEPLFAVDLARKDAGHAISLAQSVGVDLKITKVADAHLAAVKEKRGERGDLPAIYGVVREEAGLPFETK